MHMTVCATTTTATTTTATTTTTTATVTVTATATLCRLLTVDTNLNENVAAAYQISSERASVRFSVAAFEYVKTDCGLHQRVAIIVAATLALYVFGAQCSLAL